LEGLRGENFDMKINQIAQELKAFTKQAQIYYSNEVEVIIKYTVEDKHRIEDCLQMINF